MDEFRPCPFCGGKAKVVSHSYDLCITAVEIVCEKCKARTTLYHGGTLEEQMEKAKAAWNKRI